MTQGSAEADLEKTSPKTRTIQQRWRGARSVSGWQGVFNAAFPMAINARLLFSGGDEIDFVVPSLLVVDAAGRRPIIWFGDASNNGKTWLLGGSVDLVQVSPFPRFEFVPDEAIGWTAWFWPRPIPEHEQPQFLDFKRRVRATGRQVAASYHREHDQFGD